ncbi:MAG: hypothetical protein J5604_00805 [Bacteroidales bacterium]|nr:hypothetical protein [Bacteroidales bacterium]
MDYKENYQAFASVCKRNGIKKVPQLLDVFDCFCSYSFFKDLPFVENKKTNKDDDVVLELVDFIRILLKGRNLVITSSDGGSSKIYDEVLKKRLLRCASKYLLEISPFAYLFELFETNPKLIKDSGSGVLEKYIKPFDGILSETQLNRYEKEQKEYMRRNKIYQGRKGDRTPQLGGCVHDFKKAVLSLEPDYNQTTILVFIGDLMFESGVLKRFRTSFWIDNVWKSMDRNEIQKTISDWHNSYLNARKRECKVRGDGISLDNFNVKYYLMTRDDKTYSRHIFTNDKEDLSFFKSSDW